MNLARHCSMRCRLTDNFRGGPLKAPTQNTHPCFNWLGIIPAAVRPPYIVRVIAATIDRDALLGLAILTVGLLAAAGSARAEERISNVDTITIILENDILAGTDADYTAGTEIAWSFAARDSLDETSSLPKWCLKLASLTPLGGRSYDLVGSNIAIGQKVFTPQELSREELIPYDRPYAGWSFLNFALHGRRDNTLDSLSLSIGVVGPDSFAEDLQRAIHQLVDDEEPQGWDNQLRNEIGLALSYGQDTRKWGELIGQDLAAELIQTANLTLGNVETSASFGWRGRIGRNLPSDFNTGRIRHTVIGFEPPPSSSAIPETSRGRANRLYLEASLVGVFVAQNIFLDGNTFTDSHSVDKRNWIGETSLGVAYQFGATRCSLHYNYRTKEFDRQDGGFGYFSLAVSFR